MSFCNFKKIGNIIKKVVKFTENIEEGKIYKESEYLKILNQLNRVPINLNVYKGIILFYYFYTYKKLPPDFCFLSKDDIFLKLQNIMEGYLLSPIEIGKIFYNILTRNDMDIEYKEILMGSFYGALWPFMNDPQNFDIAVDYGIEIIRSAFSLDNFDFKKKLKISYDKAKIISLGGSGKKKYKLLNISSMSAVITAATGKKIGEDIIIEKTSSRATSSITGSVDIFELAGANLDLPLDKMIDVSLKVGLWIFDINRLVPRLNYIYDGRLYNVQVFAGLVGGAAIVNPVDVDLITYGLTRGSTKLCLAILSRLYPDKNILIIQGKDTNGVPVVDQISILGNTEIAYKIKNQLTIREFTPKDFGFNFKPLKHIKSSNNPIENLKEFIKFLAGYAREELKQLVAMETALNLFGLEIIDDLKMGAKLALETINSGEGLKILRDLVICSGGDIQKFNNIVNITL